MHGCTHIPKNQFRLEPKKAIAELPELAIPACIRATTPSVIGTIHFHDQFRRRRYEVDDVLFGNDHLPAELHADTTALEREVPQPELPVRRTLAHRVSALRDQRCRMPAFR